jgi:hypothetical protein
MRDLDHPVLASATILELECAILTTLFLPVQKTPTMALCSSEVKQADIWAGPGGASGLTGRG